MAGRRSERALYGYIPTIFTLACLTTWCLSHTVGGDFIGEYRLAGIRTLHGGDPWRWSELAILNRQAFPYPAVAALAFIPAATVSPMAGYLIYTVLCLGAVMGALWLCGVRDWRLYGLALLWPPVVWGWRKGNLTLPLVLGTAFVWRARDRSFLAGPAVGLLISLKTFVWPLGLWLLATRRYRAGAVAIGTGLTLNVLSWSLYGWRRLWEFIHLSSHVTAMLDSSGYGLVAIMSHLGLGTLGIPVTVCSSLVTAMAVVVMGRSRDDARALILAVVLMLVASPLIWSHYFAALLLPLAIMRPTMSRWWWAPVLLWAAPVATPTLWQSLFCWALVASVVVACLRTRATREKPESLLLARAQADAGDKAVSRNAQLVPGSLFRRRFLWLLLRLWPLQTKLTAIARGGSRNRPCAACRRRLRGEKADSDQVATGPAESLTRQEEAPGSLSEPGA